MKTLKTVKDFRELILNSKGIQIVKYFADWSGSSQMMSPIFSEISEQYQDKANFYEFDIDQTPEIVMLTGVFDLPMISIYINGEIFYQSVGLISKKSLLEKIDPVLN